MMSANIQGSLARFAGFELDLKTGELSRNGRKIRVHEQALRILSMLVARAGEVVTTVTGHRWNAQEADRLLGQLDAINARLERMAR